MISLRSRSLWALIYLLLAFILVCTVLRLFLPAPAGALFFARSPAEFWPQLNAGIDQFWSDPLPYVTKKWRFGIVLFFVLSPSLIILFKKNINRGSLLLSAIIFSGIAFIFFIYGSNTFLRIYSRHGFIHTAISHQILNGFIPPPNPFLSGAQLQYPWGYPFLGAILARLFSTHPPNAFFMINAICYIFFCGHVYLISKSLIKNTSANNLSVIFTLLAGLFVNSFFRFGFHSLPFVRVESRGFPLFVKFFNAGGEALGLMFFSLFAYATIKIFTGKDKHIVRYRILYFSAVMGSAFFYPPIIISVLSGSLVSLVLVSFLKNKAGTPFRSESTIWVTLLTLAAILFVSPYLSAISSGHSLKKVFFTLTSDKIFKFNGSLLHFIPSCILIYFARKELAKTVHREALIILIALVLSSYSAFILMEMPGNTEYKSLMNSRLLICILSGISFNMLIRHFSTWKAISLLLLFILPSYEFLSNRLGSEVSNSVRVIEKGMHLFPKSEEEAALYRWIENFTPRDSVFIDQTPETALFGKRSLFVAPDMKKTDGFKLDFLVRICENDRGIIWKRLHLTNLIYEGDLTEDSLQILLKHLSGKEAFIVARSKKLQDILWRQGFKGVFATQQGNYAVHRLTDKFG